MSSGVAGARSEANGRSDDVKNAEGEDISKSIFSDDSGSEVNEITMGRELDDGDTTGGNDSEMNKDSKAVADSLQEEGVGDTIGIDNSGIGKHADGTATIECLLSEAAAEDLKKIETKWGAVVDAIQSEAERSRAQSDGQARAEELEMMEKAVRALVDELKQSFTEEQKVIERHTAAVATIVDAGKKNLMRIVDEFDDEMNSICLNHEEEEANDIAANHMREAELQRFLAFCEADHKAELGRLERMFESEGVHHRRSLDDKQMSIEQGFHKRVIVRQGAVDACRASFAKESKELCERHAQLEQEVAENKTKLEAQVQASSLQHKIKLWKHKIGVLEAKRDDSLGKLRAEKAKLGEQLQMLKNQLAKRQHDHHAKLRNMCVMAESQKNEIRRSVNLSEVVLALTRQIYRLKNEDRGREMSAFLLEAGCNDESLTLCDTLVDCCEAAGVPREVLLTALRDTRSARLHRIQIEALVQSAMAQTDKLESTIESLNEDTAAVPRHMTNLSSSPITVAALGPAPAR